MIDVTGSKLTFSGSMQDELDGVVGKRAQKALAKLGALLQDRIKQRLSRHGTGVVYGDHQASAPGEPPAPKSGDYKDSLDVMVRIFKNVYRMEFRSALWKIYGRRLELGGPGGGAYIAPRPHIRPVLAETMPELQKILDEM